MGFPSVYPTGTTIYEPGKCWNGYTVFPAHDVGATLVDMNGNVVKQIPGLSGFPTKVLPGGFIMGSTGERNPKYGFQDELDLVQVDWDGNIVWKFAKYELVRDGRSKAKWMARQHHDYQREGNPVGYYVPGMDPLVDRGNTLILCHKNLRNPRISDKLLLDDVFIEVDWKGKIQWEWRCSDHFDEMGFDEEAKNTMSRNPNLVAIGEGMGDWMHTNSMSYLGPNRWYDQGDERFHPDNIIWDGRQTNIIAITDKKTGGIVWQVGPDYFATKQLRRLRQIIGQHHAHMIPKGLPGEGNILVFDNGGWAGYGAPNPGSFRGLNNALRDCSRILEFDPVTLKIVWQYTPAEAGFLIPVDNYKFYSGFISSAQRLPNGNTLITEGANGRLIEVSPQHEIVWEYISPFFGTKSYNQNQNMIYRAYRVPYEWVPQLDKPEEKEIPRLDNSQFRVLDSGDGKSRAVTRLKKRRGKVKIVPQLCVLPESEDE
ncbi:MAG: thioredoxin [Proteobacteria bacterium]|nr:thioredoxin [Pseudomonadota bacterium]